MKTQKDNREHHEITRHYMHIRIDWNMHMAYIQMAFGGPKVHHVKGTSKTQNDRSTLAARSRDAEGFLQLVARSLRSPASFHLRSTVENECGKLGAESPMIWKPSLKMTSIIWRVTVPPVTCQGDC